MQNTDKCNLCNHWVPQEQNGLSGWCVSTGIAKNKGEFNSNSLMCQCEHIRTEMDAVFLVTGPDFGCIHFHPKMEK